MANDKPDETSEMPVLAPEAPTSAFEEFLERNKTRLIIALVVAVLAIVGVILYKHFAQAAKNERAQAFTTATTVSDLDKVISTYGGSLAGGNALVRKAAILWDEGDEAGSVAALQIFVSDYGDHPLLPQAVYGLASKAVAMNKPDDARKHLNRVIKDFGSSSAAGFAYVDLGDLEKAAGKTEEARKHYELVSTGKQFAGHAAQSTAKERLRNFDVKLPAEEERPLPKPAPKPEGDPGKPPVVDPGKPPVVDPGKPPVVDPGKKPAVDPAKKPAVDPAKKPAVDPAKKPAVNPAKKPAVDPAAAPKP